MECDVIVAGGGPNGLMLAAELALAGIRPVVLEERTGPRTEQRANGMVGQVVRMMDRRGLLERLLPGSGPPQPAPQFMFAGFPVPFDRLADNPVYTVLVPQARIEEVLGERVAELGGEIRRGHALAGFTETADEVRVEIDGPAERYALTARYLVGADGGHSRTRKLAGIGFPGVTNDRTVSRTAQVAVDAADIDPASGGLRVPGYGVIPPFLHHRTEQGMVTFAQFPDGRVILSTSLREDADESVPMTFAELTGAFRRVVGADAPVREPATPGMLRRTVGGNSRMADRFRAGRVLLVGDAAHVHSAIGGNGLNLGLQDAVNLGWKLAATLRGQAPDGLLDTYESERRPVAGQVLTQTMAQGVLVGPGPEVTALRTVFGELLADEPAIRRIANLIAGADIRYPHTGGWAPDLRVGGTRLAELTRTGRPLLLDLTGAGPATGPTGAGPATGPTGDGAADGLAGESLAADGLAGDGLAGVVAGWRDRVDVVSGPAAGAGGATAMLLRPDCYVAWESRAAQPDSAALRTALSRWFGEPALTGRSSPRAG